MHEVLALPPPSSLFPTSFGQRPEPVNSIGNPFTRPWSAKAEEQTYPSPPMSDSQSPHHHAAQPIEPGLSYPPPPPPLSSESRRPEPYPYPQHHHHQAPHYDPRHAPSPHSMQYQRPLYASEEHRTRPHPYHSQPRPYEHPHPSSIPAGPWYYMGTPGNPGPVSNPLPSRAIIGPVRNAPKPARRTKSHVASACINCKKAHLSCDVQRPCQRCVSSGKQVSRLSWEAIRGEKKTIANSCTDRTPAKTLRTRSVDAHEKRTRKSPGEAKIDTVSRSLGCSLHPPQVLCPCSRLIAQGGSFRS